MSLFVFLRGGNRDEANGVSESDNKVDELVIRIHSTWGGTRVVGLEQVKSGSYMISFRNGCG